MDEKQYSTFSTSSSKEELTSSSKSKMSSSSKPWFAGIIIFNAFFLLVVFAFNGLSASENTDGIFKSTQGDQANKYYLDITPAGWTFSIWGFIYTFQAMWVLYGVFNISRKTPDGHRAYLSPVFIPPATYLFYLASNVGNIVWLFLFDRDYIQGAFVVLFLSSTALIVALIFSYRSLDQASSSLVAQGRRLDIWVVRGVVHNGLAIYASWTCIATLLNMAMVITYSSGSDISVSMASTTALVVLSSEMATFVFTDLIFLDRYSRYTFTPYIVVVMALIGSIVQNWESGATNSIFSAVLLAIGVVALVVKVILSVYRHRTHSSYNSGKITSTLSV